MTMAIFLDVPSRTQAHTITDGERPDADLPPGTLVFVVPPVALPPAAGATDGEPTWEDAEWQ
jgi:hypothetical protein